MCVLKNYLLSLLLRMPRVPSNTIINTAWAPKCKYVLSVISTNTNPIVAQPSTVRKTNLNRPSSIQRAATASAIVSAKYIY